MTSAVTALAQAEAGVESAAAAVDGKTPHFYGPFANYANSPLPAVQGGIVHVGHSLIARQFATDYATPPGDFGRVFVTVPDRLPNGLLKAFKTFNQTDPAGSPTSSEGGVFHAYVLRPTGNADEYKVVYDSGELVVPAATDPGGNVVSYPMPDVAVKDGDVLGFYGQGIPVDTGTGTDTLSYPAPDQPPLLDGTIKVGSAEYPKTDTSRTYSFAADVVDLSGNNDVVVGGVKKFVDTLPGVGAANHNDLGQYLPVAEPDTTTYPGADYYEIGVVQYREKLHRDLPATLLRGYVQLSTNKIPGQGYVLKNALLDGTSVAVTEKNGDPILAVDEPHYLGPIIAATKDRPVRIKFRDLLPKGVDGDLFLPVDTTVMGSGMGPKMGGMAEPDPQNPMCGETPKPAGCYTENRATLHLHGGITPWISDGTPHQWITAGESTDYPKGVSVSNVPDMPDPGDGSQTFFYTNQQSARMMFYHDHSYGITRLNVYAGEAAGYLISDETEKQLVSDHVIPGAAETMPLILQDKTFVPSRAQLDTTDPLWDNGRWGGEGNLWMPHVYMPAQNPGDTGGANAFGRWAYGPCFWPPNTNQIKHGPIPYPYYDPACDSQVQWCEPPEIPGVPNNSMGMEAFHDTPLVNGTAYPETTVDPKAYRFKILNAAGDRFWNLSLYQADATKTEVALNAAEVAAAKDDPFGVFPTPDTSKSPEGPSWLQIGTEGGFLPSPVEVKPQPITWVTDPTVFNAGDVDKHSLLLGPAERADVIVDFSAYAGKDLILYNDAPAAFPARDPRYDYYTDNADLTSTGGAPTTLPGYGPNTRTVMRIHVAATAPADPFDAQKVKAAFAHKADGSGVFEKSQKPIVVGQGAYNDAYGTAFRNTAPRDGLARIHDFSLTFDTLSGKSLTIPFQNKAIQDEMGEAYERDYGRMGGNLGLEAPNAQAGQQNLILYPYVNPASEIVDGVTDAQPISTESDGTQIRRSPTTGSTRTSTCSMCSSSTGSAGTGSSASRTRTSWGGRTRCASARWRTRSSRCARSCRRRRSACPTACGR
jgi:FtsP/CotA-like multicopper oxidase with cupredoxin domain